MNSSTVQNCHEEIAVEIIVHIVGGPFSSYTKTSDLKYLRSEIQKIGDWIERQGFLAESKVMDIYSARKQTA